MTSESKGERSQSYEHMRMKLYFYENIPLSNKITRIEEEYKVAGQIIDVYVELANKTKIAIEIQHSKISNARLIERTRNYSKQGIYVLWILNGNSFKREPKKQDGLRISKLEFLLHKMYHGRVYYLNVDSEGLLSGVYALSYVPYFNIKDIVYKKKAITKRSVNYQEIEDLKLKCTSNRYKLAMFEEISIKSICEDEIFEYLKKICEKRDRARENGNNNFLIIPILDIVSLLKKRYGFYLVYEILRNSKVKASKIKIAKIGFMKDNKGKVRESIKIYLKDYITTSTPKLKGK